MKGGGGGGVGFCTTISRYYIDAMHIHRGGGGGRKGENRENKPVDTSHLTEIIFIL